jgi:putative phosphoribosyl transferase
MVTKIARFVDRTEAGRILATKLKTFAKRTDVIVLALPSGGVPVALEVVKALALPLDVCLVRKLGVPGHQELAMGAISFAEQARRTQCGGRPIASDGVRVLNYDIVSSLGISSHKIDEVAAREVCELQRRDQVYRGNRPSPNLKDHTIILIDDGIATGASMRAAINVLRAKQPQSMIVATPMAPSSTYKKLKTEVDDVVCLIMPEPFYSVSLWYDDFPQTTDEEVRQLLAEQWALSDISSGG